MPLRNLAQRGFVTGPAFGQLVGEPAWITPWWEPSEWQLRTFRSAAVRPISVLLSFLDRLDKIPEKRASKPLARLRQRDECHDISHTHPA